MNYDISPVPKPRMTQRDKWSQRPCVMRYWAFKDECRLKSVKIPDNGSHIIFYIPMPKSWSVKKKLIMDGKPHIVRPDIDNFLKGIFDSVYDEDCVIYDVRVTKLWANKGSITIT